MKTCRKCKGSKPLAMFNRKAESRDGHAPTCKSCVALKRKEAAVRGTGPAMPDLTPEQKKHVYTSVILRMRNNGLASSKTADEMLARVGEL